jgi:hypothetical protein
MITRIEIEGFKSLKKVALDLGPFNLFIGTNASGKSNFFDALRVLQGIGNGFTVDEIFNGKPRSATSAEWAGIRGGSAKAAFAAIGKTDLARKSTSVSFAVDMRHELGSKAKYEIEFDLNHGTVENDRFTDGERNVFVSGGRRFARQTRGIRYFPGAPRDEKGYQVLGSVPSLAQMAKSDPPMRTEHATAVQSTLLAFANMQQLSPSVGLLRSYAQTHAVRRMGEHGEDFAGIVKAIIAGKKTRSSYLSWLRELTPIDLDDVAVLPGALKEPMFAVKKKGVVYPAPILSDGTLRFAAITAAFFQPTMPGLIAIEEIENGLHPTRIRLLVELLKSQSGRKTQVFATTHSPLVVAWLNETDYEHVFFCRRNPRSGASIITPLSELPHFVEAARTNSVADMIVEGWLETAE